MAPPARQAFRRGAGPVSEVTDAFVRELHGMLTTLVERAPLFADLRSRGLADDLVQDTLITITRRIQRGHAIDDPFSYATRCVENLARRSYIRARETAVEADTLELLAPAIEDVADRVEQRADMREVLDMVRSVNTVIAALEPLELELVRAELSRADQKKLAARLGISRPTLYRRKGPAIGAFVAAVAARAGTAPCAEHAGALLAAAGDSGFDGARAATEHAATCEQCSETIRHLSVARHGLAIIAPIPLVESGPDPARMVERAHAALDAVGDWIRVGITRIGDPTPLGGSATKTAALVAAACTGGGGIYCAVEGVPPQLRAPFTHERKHEQPPAQARAAAAPAAPPATGPATRAIRQLSTVVSAVERQEAARRKAASQARTARAAAAKRRRQQAAREFAARSAPGSPTALGTREFVPSPPPSPAATVTRREFAKPVTSAGSTTQTKREFGAP